MPRGSGLSTIPVATGSDAPVPDPTTDAGVAEAGSPSGSRARSSDSSWARIALALVRVILMASPGGRGGQEDPAALTQGNGRGRPLHTREAVSPHTGQVPVRPVRIDTNQLTRPR